MHRFATARWVVPLLAYVGLYTHTLTWMYRARARQAYIDRFVDTFVDKLSVSIESAVQRQRGEKNVFFEELYRHLSFAHTTGASFLVRGPTVRRLMQYVASDHPHPLVVYGPSGCGKTGLLAKFVKDMAGQDSTTVVCRFAGLTQASTNIDDLLASLLNQVMLAEILAVAWVK